VGEEVGDGVSVSWHVIKYEIEVLKEFHPMGLSAGDFLGLVEVLEIFVISSDVNGMVGAQEVGVAAFESIDDGGHFFIVDVVVSFSW
jgi:hypothetical protein